MDLICPICYDTYDDQAQVPRILQCGHTFCQRCLMDLRTSNMLTCPTCRNLFSPDVNQLIKNFTILDFLSQKKAKEDIPTAKMSTCVKHKNKKCKYLCEDCQTSICSKCITSDHKGHNIIEHEGLTEEIQTQKKL